MLDLPTTRAEALRLGERYYNPGHPCPHGHQSKYRAKDWTCYECHITNRRNRLREQRRLGTLPPSARARRPHLENSIYTHTRRYLFLPSYRSRWSNRLGCSSLILRAYIETLFKPGMTWENYGRGPDRWCLDHKIPLNHFNLQDPVQLAKCQHYTNLQPLWFPENCKKAALLPLERVER